MKYSSLEIIKKIISNSILLLIGNSFGKLCIFISGILAARILTVNDFGQYSTIRNSIMLLNVLISGSISSGSTKIISNSINTNNIKLKIISLFTSTIFVCFLFIIILLFFKNNIIQLFFLNEYKLLTSIYASCLLLVSVSISTLFQSITIGLELYKQIAIINLIISIISIPIIYYLTTNFGINGAIYGISIYFIVDLVFNCIIIYKKIKNSNFLFEIKSLLKEINYLYKYFGVFFIGVIINAFSFWYSRIMVINHTNTFEKIAIFDASYQWLSVIMIITGATTSVALPMLSKIVNFGEREYKLKVFNINLIVNILISITLAFVIGVFSEEILYIYGEKYIEGKTTLRYLCIMSILFTIATVYHRYIVSINKIVHIISASIIGTILLFFVLFISDFSCEGLTLSYCAYYGSNIIFYIIIKEIYEKYN